MDSEDFNKTIFNSLVWEELEKVKDDRVIREFITLAKNAITTYESGGGTFPTIEYLIGMAQDTVNNQIRNKEEELKNPKEFKELVRNSWIKKYSKNDK